jgi:hypothetical protein
MIVSYENVAAGILGTLPLAAYLGLGGLSVAVAFFVVDHIFGDPRPPLSERATERPTTAPHGGDPL